MRSEFKRINRKKRKTTKLFCRFN